MEKAMVAWHVFFIELVIPREITLSFSTLSLSLFDHIFPHYLSCCSLHRSERLSFSLSLLLGEDNFRTKIITELW